MATFQQLQQQKAELDFKIAQSLDAAKKMAAELEQARVRHEEIETGTAQIMALTPSTMLPLGTPLPLDLILRELAAGSTSQVSGSPLELGGPGVEALAGRPVLVLFLCAHCPFVKHIEPELTRLVREHGGGAGKVIVIDTENAFRMDRVAEIA